MNKRYDWEPIRIRWEAGESAHSLSQEEGMPTSQAISQRARLDGWVSGIDDVPEISLSLPDTVCEGLDQKQVLVLKHISRGLTQKDAARLAGVVPDTVSRWKKRDDGYLLAHNVAVGIKNANRVDRVERSSDTRDQRWLLERDPDSRDDYGGQQGHTFIGNRWNVLGDIDLGIQLDNHRLEDKQNHHNGLPTVGDDAAAVIDGGKRNES